MKETDKEMLTQIKRLEEQRTAVSEDISLIENEREKREQVWELQKHISDTLLTLSEERAY